MPQQITRFAWTDDTGTPASPVGDGTKINNAQLQLLFDRIDALFSAATFTVSGTFRADGFGTHQLSASGTGANNLLVRNTAAGTGNYARVSVGNDTSADATTLTSYSSTHSTGANLTILDGALSAGVIVRATHATGVLYLSTAAGHGLRITAAGRVAVGTTNSAPVGALSVIGNSFVAHGAAIGALATGEVVINGGGGSPDWGQLVWGDGTGYKFHFGTRSGGNFTSRVVLLDSGPALFSDGAEGAPGVSFISDTDTGWWWSNPGVPKMSASVGGWEILRVEAESGLHKPVVRIIGDHSTDHCAKLIVERKASATTAPGVLALQALNGTTYYIYPHTDGTLRMGTTEPTPLNGEGVGGKVGTQT